MAFLFQDYRFIPLKMELIKPLLCKSRAIQLEVQLGHF